MHPNVQDILKQESQKCDDIGIKEKSRLYPGNKFEKNQNRIATFLGVNRSSVNRRCKDYNLE